VRADGDAAHDVVPKRHDVHHDRPQRCNDRADSRGYRQQMELRDALRRDAERRVQRPRKRRSAVRFDPSRPTINASSSARSWAWPGRAER
jgi:hypothetical protein